MWTKIALTTTRDYRWVIPLIALLALIPRFWRLDSVPPGWRDDELINSLVISQKAIDGDLAFYYSDASGHEALYHILSAATLALFGPGVPGIRWLPAVLGTVTVVLTYLLATILFGRKVAILSAVCLAVSFWSLMYSRIGIRHISLPVFMLVAFYAFWRGLYGIRTFHNQVEHSSPDRADDRPHYRWFVMAGLILGIGFYTYFASRGIPIILILVCLYLWLFQRDIIRRRWKGILIMFALAAALAIPLVVTLLQQPETEARIEELAVPIIEAMEGNFVPLGQHVSRTLNMFHSDGDDEWLYNIPHRPVFGPVGAAFFWGGFIVAAWYALKPALRVGLRITGRSTTRVEHDDRLGLEAASAFVLIWWLVGISPGFISIPAASLGHTIVAQSAVYIIVALPLVPIGHWLTNKYQSDDKRPAFIIAGLGGLLLLSLVVRDLPDYFHEWPSRGMTRFLYRADIKELADYLKDHEELTDFGVAGLLAGPWDLVALEIDLDQDRPVLPRWYNPEKALLTGIAGERVLAFIGYPGTSILYGDLYQPVHAEITGGYRLATVDAQDKSQEGTFCYENGLCLISAKYDPDVGTLDLHWLASRTLDLPSMPLISNPPPPGVYSGLRLSVFAQKVDARGEYLTGDDGFWVDAASLRPGDTFLQQHWLEPITGGQEAIIFGLYDPMTGERILTEDGLDHVRLEP
jgi:4-amino-4-deoxy-L-arabinose transferase-like glycosyltransferase